MVDWKEVIRFEYLDHYIRVEQSICEHLWESRALMFLKTDFREPDLRAMVLPYQTMYLVVADSFDVWRLIQPTEKGGGSFRHMGIVKSQYQENCWFPIHPEKRGWKLGTYVDVFEIHKCNDLQTRLENAPDSPPVEYE